MPTIESIQSTLRPIFEREPVYRVILFGSYAKGLATKDSDIDLVLDSRGKLIGLGFFRVLEQVTEVLGKDVDMIELSQLEPGSAILEAIQREGVVIYDREVA